VVDCGGRRGEPALQNLERKAYIVPALVVTGQIVEVAHLVAHVLGYGRVELRF
jgi:hypothetical protein